MELLTIGLICASVGLALILISIWADYHWFKKMRDRKNHNLTRRRRNEKVLANCRERIRQEAEDE